MATVCILRNSRLNHVRVILRSEFNKCMIKLIFHNEIQGCEFYNLKAYFLKQCIILRKLSPVKIRS